MFNSTLEKMKKEFDKYSNGVVLYLKEKYNQDFELLDSIGETLGTSGDRWGARLKNGLSNESFTVFGCFDENGYKYSDSYYSVLIQNDYEKFISDILISEFDNFKLFIEISKDSPNPAGLNKDVAVEDIWRYTEHEKYTFMPKITLLLPLLKSQKNNYKDKLTIISDKIAEFKLMAWIEAYTMELENYKSVKLTISDDNDFEKLLPDNPDIFYIDNKYNVVYKSLLMRADKIHQEYISDEKLAMLCSVVYLNGLINNQYMGALGTILEYIKITDYADSMINGNYPCEMTKDQWNAVVDGITKDSQLYWLKIIKSIDVNEQNSNDYPDIMPGHRAICFMDIWGNAYIVFRGTCGDNEWYDNATGMVLESTKQQEAAADFVKEVREDKDINIKQLVVTGHSKGGNKAQFAALTTPDGYVNRCVALDGQGFSLSFIKRYEANIKKRADKITLLAEQRDFVNCLGFYIKGTSFYRGWRGNALKNMPYGYAMPYFHCPDALVNEYGVFGSSHTEGCIPSTINRLIKFILNGSKYVKNPYDIAVDVIALLMKNKKSSNEQTAEALKNLIMVFMELTSKSVDFRNEITELVYIETNVILSTIEFASKKKPNSSFDAPQKILNSLVISKLTKELFLNFISLKYLVETLFYMVGLIKNILEDSKESRLTLIGFVIDFIGNLLSNLSYGKAGNAVLDFLFHWTELQACFAKQLCADSSEMPPTNELMKYADKNIDDVLSDLEKTLSAWQNIFDEK